MTLNHLFSPSLFDELFQHDIVACDGHVLTSDEGFQKYREFLMDRSRMRTAQIFQERKDIVDKLQSLLKTSIQPTREVKILLKKIALSMTEEGTVTLGKVDEFQQDLGPSHKKRSLSERRVAAHKAGLKVQTRDLKHLDDWLSRISGPKVRVKRAPERTKLEWKCEEFKYRAKVESVLKEMSKGRHRFVKKSYNDVQYKWISTMERILENIAESKKTFGVPSKKDKESENVLDRLKDDKKVENVISPLKGDKEAENVLDSLKGDKKVENVLAPLKNDIEAENFLVPLKEDKESENVLAPLKGDKEVESVLFPLKGDKQVDNVLTPLESGKEAENVLAPPSIESPINDEDDNVRCIPETGSKTENPIPIDEPDDRIVGKWTEETSTDSPVDDEEENVRRVIKTGSNAENWIRAAGSEDRIAEFKREENRAEEKLADSPVGDEEDNARRVPKIGSKTENSIAVARPDDGIADFERDGKWTEERSTKSPVDDEDENVQHVPGAGSKTENRIPVAEPEDTIAEFGSKGYWAEKTSSDSAVEDEDENVRRVSEIGSKMENSIVVAGPKETTDAESEDTVTLDPGRRTAHYRKATPEEDS